MSRSKTSSAIIISIGAIMIIFIGVIAYAMVTDDSFSSPFNKMNQSDFKNFEEMGNQLFLLYDDGYLTVGEVLGTADYHTKKPKVESIVSKYKREIIAIYLVDKDVVLISFGAVFQSVDGIAIRRNNAELKNTYEGTGFDEGTLNYSELLENVFHFSAGL
ncbi:hypothetical protein [Anoxynatronum sibiricum]|uniref:Uncharacterized protein n=1 Tax=Anoxynatronum sibiricum TaxID=210623 RepID=A0ABU9VT96_9CLOT